MDIDFLKLKSKKSKKEKPISYSVEYSEIATPPPAPHKSPPPPKVKPKKTKSTSWWKKLFSQNSKNSKPKNQENKPILSTSKPTNELNAYSPSFNTKKHLHEIKKRIDEQAKINATFKTPDIKPESKLKSSKPKKIEKPKKAKPAPKSSPLPKAKVKKSVKSSVKSGKAKPEPRKDAGVILPPQVSEKAPTSNLEKKDLAKIKNKELAKHFLDVNLIPPQLLAELNPIIKIRGLIRVAVLALVLILLIYAGMTSYQYYLFSKAKDTQIQINNIEAQINEFIPWQKEAIAFNQKVDNVSTLLRQHIYWSRLFSLLEKNTLPNVYYSNFSGNVNGVFTLSATAPNYESVSEQIFLFRQAEFINDVTVIAATSSNNSEAQENETNNTNQVKFNISLQIDPQIFYPNNEL